jgi:hypothetical protein
MIDVLKLSAPRSSNRRIVDINGNIIRERELAASILPPSPLPYQKTKILQRCLQV